ncbi:MAG: glycosyltransferase [Candidatus Omnitrophota bacterium]|jgi:glycosyltransferase involved in cell wall biosynthesis
MKIAILGIRGIPSCYSGFEVCAEELASRLAERGHDLRVYCRSRYFSLESKTYKGIRLIVIPTINNKYLDTFIHTLLGTLHVLFTDTEVIQYFGVGNSIFTFLPRIFGKKTFINVDGLDWTRKKWPYPAKLYLKICAFLATCLPNHFITDSREIADYYARIFDKKPHYIAYGIPVYSPAPSLNREDTLSKFSLEQDKYILFVGRLVPENNIEDLISAYNQIDTDLKLVIVGDSRYQSGYVQYLKNNGNPNIVFTGFLGGDEYLEICSRAYIFVETTEASGTHPALLDAMGLGNCVLVNGIPTNLEVIKDSGLSYDGARKDADLKEKLEWLLDNPELLKEYKIKAVEHVKRHYSWDRVTERYEKLWLQALSGRAK